MSLYKQEGVRQTHWAPSEERDPERDFWYANLSVDVTDLQAIEQAKTIVNAIEPQMLSTKYGTHYYSFIRREFLLNMLLHFWHDHQRFPSGWVCWADEMPMTAIGNSGWSMFRPRKRGREYPKPRWLQVPTYEQAKAHLEAKAREAKEAQEAAARTAHIPRRSFGYFTRWGKE